MSNFSFPCRKEEYCRIVGELLPTTISKVLFDCGFRPEASPLSANDVDLRVYLADRLVLVAEILNWSISSRLADKRKNKIIKNLIAFSNVARALIHSVPNSNIDDEFAEKGIDTVCIGFQLLPNEFYSFFVEKGHIVKRRPVTMKAFHDIRATIANYLNEKGFTVAGI